MLPAADDRMEPIASESASENCEARGAALYCGRLRSYTLAGANFVLYDDGVKSGKTHNSVGFATTHMRRQMAALRFHKAPSQHLEIGMLVPTPNIANSAAPTTNVNLMSSLRSLPFEAKTQGPPIPDTSLLKVVPPKWNVKLGVLQAVFPGRANCTSNKNVQLADVRRPDEAALVIGKLQSNEVSLDFDGAVSPFQAFAAALAVCDVSSVRRRF